MGRHMAPPAGGARLSMDTLLQDIRYAMRSLRRSPAFTFVAIATLTLAIGANTAIFSVLDSVLLRPLDYAAPEQLVVLRENKPQSNIVNATITGPAYLAWQKESRSFSGIASYITQNGVVNGLGEPIEIPIGIASPEFFHILGQQPILGRTFSSDEHVQSGAAAVMISRGFWLRHFGGDSSVIGRSVILNDHARPVIGVIPDGGEYTRSVEIWVAMPMDVIPRLTTGNHLLYAIGRLRDGARLDAARAELASISERVYAPAPEGARGWIPSATPILESTVGDTSRVTVISLFGGVTFVLLIACANLANLTVMRAQSRNREVALRAALGAGRLRLTRSLITESAVLAFVGGGLGLLLGVWGIDAIRALAQGTLPRLEGVQMNVPVLAFTAMATIAATALFGVLPAIRASRADLHTSIRERDTRVAGRGAGRDALAIVEIALALVLAAGAGLLAQSLARLHRQPLGYDPVRVVDVDIDLPPSRFSAPPARAQLLQQIEEQVRALPGVVSAGSTRALPLESGGPDTEFGIEGRAPDAPNGKGSAFYTPITDGYLPTMRATIVAGRNLTSADLAANAPQVAVVNETLAQKYWPGTSPLGARLVMGPWRVEVVGVVRDLRQRFLRNAVQPQMFLPFTMDPTLSISLVVRTAGEPLALAPALHKAVWAVDPKLPVEEWTMQSLMNDQTAETRFTLTLMSAFAVLAILLAMIGVYGVVSFGVAQRRKEIGVRMALGAQQSRVLAMVLRRGALIAAIGVTIGAGAAIALGLGFRRLLFGVQPTDPLTLAGAATLVALTIVVASLVPARRAARVDPMIALRSE